MPLSELIERVARLKDNATKLRGVGRFGAENFTEDKDALFKGLRRLEDDLRRRGVGNDA